MFACLTRNEKHKNNILDQDCSKRAARDALFEGRKANHSLIDHVQMFTTHSYAHILTLTQKTYNSKIHSSDIMYNMS